mgnify:CR=1 FL=1
MRLFSTLRNRSRRMIGTMFWHPTFTASEHGAVSGGIVSPVTTPTRPRRRLSISLARVLGAECSLCRGVGCEACAQTGLR